MALLFFAERPQLSRSVSLGFKFNPRFADDIATCMIVTEDIFVKLLTEDKFKALEPTGVPA